MIFFLFMPQKYNQDFNREHQFASSLTADVVLQYNGTGWVIASALPLELKLTCGSAHTPDPPGQDVLARLAVLVVCDAISSHTKTYKIGDGDYELKKVDDNTYTVTVIADQYVEKYNAVYPGHTLYDNNTKTIKLVYRYGEWTVVGSNSVTFNVSCEQKYTVTYTDGVDGEVIFKDQVSYKKPGEKTPAFRGTTPTRTGYKFIRWEPAVAANVTGNATYTAVWEEAAPQVTKPTKEFLIKEFKIATVKCTTEGSGHGEQSYPLTESSISIGDPWTMAPTTTVLSLSPRHPTWRCSIRLRAARTPLVPLRINKLRIVSTARIGSYRIPSMILFFTLSFSMWNVRT